MDQSWWISAIFGAALLIGGLLLMWSHYRTWQSQQHDEELDPKEVQFFRRRFRRRMQASGLMALIGVLLPFGDSVERFGASPGWFAAFWMIVLLLVLWLFVLAASDLLSTRTHSTVALNRLRAQQAKLEREATALRQQMDTHRNGSHSATNGNPEASP